MDLMATEYISHFYKGSLLPFLYDILFRENDVFTMFLIHPIRPFGFLNRTSYYPFEKSFSLLIKFHMSSLFCRYHSKFPRSVSLWISFRPDSCFFFSGKIFEL